MFENGFFGNIFSAYSESGSSVISNSSTSKVDLVSSKEFFLCICTALVIGFLISAVYMFTHRKEGYSQSYVVTTIMLPSMVCLILLVINSVAGALSVAGAFSLVRFRSVAGDPKDIAYLFFAILAVVMILIAELNFGGCKKTHMTLKIAIPENLDYQGIFEPVLNKYTAFHKLRRVKTTNFGTLFELIYSVEIDDTIDQKKFIDELRALNGNMTVNLVLFKYDDKVYEN